MRVFIAIFALLLTIGTGFGLYIYSSIYGNPLTKLKCRSTVESYLAERYPSKDFRVDRVYYALKSGNYPVHVVSDGERLTFLVSCDSNGLLTGSDNYALYNPSAEKLEEISLYYNKAVNSARDFLERVAPGKRVVLSSLYYSLTYDEYLCRYRGGGLGKGWFTIGQGGEMITSVSTGIFGESFDYSNGKLERLSHRGRAEKESGRVIELIEGLPIFSELNYEPVDIYVYYPFIYREGEGSPCILELKLFTLKGGEFGEERFLKVVVEVRKALLERGITPVRLEISDRFTVEGEDFIENNLLKLRLYPKDMELSLEQLFKRMDNFSESCEVERRVDPIINSSDQY